jgi:uncharacterized membrane protein YbaN (DUF454 family)
MRSAKNLPYLLLGHFFLLLGFVGLFLPLLPTTPFILLSAFFYSKGSTRMHQWLLGSKYFGSLIEDWNKKGAINIKAKILSTIMIVLLFSYSLFLLQVILILKFVVALIGVLVLGFILSRPSS